MKFAAITDWKGFAMVDSFGLSYHLVLAQHVLVEFRYADYYSHKHDKGDFIMMDNGAAEDGTLVIAQLIEAAEKIQPDEIILPDVMCDAQKTIDASFNEEVLALVPPRKRAVVPQGDSFDEWLTCANHFVDNMEFVTLCVPKHMERFPGGRVKALETIQKLGWHNYYNIHLLGIWGNPRPELLTLQETAPWARGIDSAMPFALAQNGILMDGQDIGHLPHVWGKTFSKLHARYNIDAILSILGSR